MSPPIVSTLGRAHRGTRQGRDRGRGKHREQGQGHQQQHVGMRMIKRMKERWTELYINSHQDTLWTVN